MEGKKFCVYARELGCVYKTRVYVYRGLPGENFCVCVWIFFFCVYGFLQYQYQYQYRLLADIERVVSRYYAWGLRFDYAYAVLARNLLRDVAGNWTA